MHDALRVSRPLDRAPEHSLGRSTFLNRGATVTSAPHTLTGLVTTTPPGRSAANLTPDRLPPRSAGSPCSQAGGRRHTPSRSGAVAPSPCRRARPTPDRKISAIGTIAMTTTRAGLLMRPAVEAVRLVMPWAAGGWLVAYRG